MKINAAELLNAQQLKKTPLRLEILSLILNQPEAITQKFIIENLEKNKIQSDRVTIYRNLNLLKEYGLIHEVEKNYYVGCNHKCHKHAHILFFCQKCESHYEAEQHSWIENFQKSLTSLNFLSINESIKIKGTCQKCAKV